MTLANPATIQSLEEIDAFYGDEDPWEYDTNPDDQMRVEMMLCAIPSREFVRVLDIGCGNGFLTSRLPGKDVVGVDISGKALEWARKRCSGERYSFVQSGLLQMDADNLGQFDLVVMTGVAYPQYIGAAFSLAALRVDTLLKPGGWLVHAHIEDWFKSGFPYRLIDRYLYPYRDRWHLLESYIK